MQKNIEVPMVLADGTNVGTIFIDKNNDMKIDMKKKVRPDQMATLLEYAKGFAESMHAVNSYSRE